MATAADLKLQLAEDIGSLAADPYRYALYAFPWGEGELRDMTGPREWQRDVMNDIRDHLQDPETRFEPCRIAVASELI